MQYNISVLDASGCLACEIQSMQFPVKYTVDLLKLWFSIGVHRKNLVIGGPH